MAQAGKPRSEGLARLASGEPFAEVRKETVDPEIGVARDGPGLGIGDAGAGDTVFDGTPDLLATLLLGGRWWFGS